MGLLDGVLTGLLGGGGTTPTPVQDAGLLPTLSLPDLLPTLSLPTLPGLPGLGSDPTTTTTTSSSSVPSVTLASTSSSSPASSSLPLSTSSPSLSPSSSIPPPSSTLPPSTSLGPVTSAGSNGAAQQTLTNVVTVDASSPSQSASAAPVAAKSFLQNKPLSGTIFALAGLLALVLILTAVTWVVRRRARNRLLDDAVSFDPGLLAAANDAEKGHGSNASLYTYRSEPAYYGGQQQQQQPVYYPNAAYAPPMPHTAVTVHHHNIPRVPVPAAEIPIESHQERRESVEESEFWARTLKVTNQ